MTDVVIIGGGLNGLVAGAWLARRKRSTVIVDRQAVVGGAAVTAEIAPGVRGPALSHSLGPVHIDVLRALDLDGRITFVTPDPALTSLGSGDTSLVFHRDPVVTAAAINRLSSKDAARWRAFLDLARALAGVIAEINRQAPPAMDGPPVQEWWPLLGSGWRARGLGRHDLAQLARWLTMSVADILDEWFENDVLKAAIAARAIAGNFVGPRSAGTGWMLLQRLAEDPLPVGSGVTMQGGPGALTGAVAGVARAAGAEMRCGVRVSKILQRDGRAAGVVLENGDVIEARAVLSAIDPRRTFLDLIDAAEIAPTFLERMRNVRARGVLAKVNLALRAAPVLPALAGDPAPARGRWLIARDLNHLERAFDAAKYGKYSADPWLEISVPTLVDASLAPAGTHMMSVYAHCVPRELRDTAWQTEREVLGRTILRAIKTHVPDIESIVTHQQILTPQDLELDCGMSGGHIFHGEPTLDQSWMARPQLGWAKYRTPVPGLFLGSAGTHPGGGLTGMSGMLAARAVARFLAYKKKDRA